MFDSEKSKQQAKIILQQLQKHTNESLRSLALRIETLVKTAYSLYTEDYRNSVMNQTFIRCLDNEFKKRSIKETCKPQTNSTRTRNAIQNISRENRPNGSNKNNN